jgi:hypothetical protein
MDVVANRHGRLDAASVTRVLKSGGTLLTQEHAASVTRVLKSGGTLLTQHVGKRRSRKSTRRCPRRPPTALRGTRAPRWHPDRGRPRGDRQRPAFTLYDTRRPGLPAEGPALTGSATSRSPDTRSRCAAWTTTSAQPANPASRHTASSSGPARCNPFPSILCHREGTRLFNGPSSHRVRLPIAFQIPISNSSVRLLERLVSTFTAAQLAIFESAREVPLSP